MVFDFPAYLSEKRVGVDQALKERLMPLDPPTLVDEALSYSLMAGGKRLRPILCIAAAEAVGGNGSDCMGAACALEMIHTYSLIHDDLPAMDDDDLRRGFATCHKKFGEAAAILAGDALLTLAFAVLSEEAIHSACPERWLQVTRQVALASGHRGMVGGQMIDLVSEGKQIHRSELEAMHRLKTGALIEASVYCGGCLGGGDERSVHALSSYARHIGLAFQVTDDLLDITGDPFVMGKPAGSDIENNKATYPALLGFEKARSLAADLIEQAHTELNIFGPEAMPLRAIADYVLCRKR